MFELPLVQDLTTKQKEVMDLPFLSRNDEEVFHLVSGPPGSGKSVMAVYRAMNIHAAGEPVRLMMFNKLLSLWTEGALEKQNIDTAVVSTFHKWFGGSPGRPGWFKKTYGEAPPKIGPWEYDFDECLRIAESQNPGEMREHLIIDEGQDMDPKIWIFLRTICRSLTVFADENQQITKENSTLQEIQHLSGIKHKVALETNFRNTPQIARFASCFYTGDGSPPLKVTDSIEDGDPPSIGHHKDINESKNRIRIFANNNATASIGVFVPSIGLVNKFYNRLKADTALNVPVQRHHSKMWKDGKQLDGVINFADPGIKILTYQAAKGLEFNTVFLPELQKYNIGDSGINIKKQLYVLASRAKKQLFLFGSGEGAPPVLNVLRDCGAMEFLRDERDDEHR